MATLILSKKLDGTISGRCDARCYNARGFKCKCICGGINHGKGRNQAIHNTEEFQHTRDRAGRPGDYVFPPAQLTLFQEQQT